MASSASRLQNKDLKLGPVQDLRVTFVRCCRDGTCLSRFITFLSAPSPLSPSILNSRPPLSLPYVPAVAGATAPTSRPLFPWARGAIRGPSTSLSSCYKWRCRDGEGPRLCFEGQWGRSPALCRWLLPPPPQTRKAKIQLWNRGPVQPRTHTTIVACPGIETLRWVLLLFPWNNKWQSLVTPFPGVLDRFWALQMILFAFRFNWNNVASKKSM